MIDFHTHSKPVNCDTSDLMPQLETDETPICRRFRFTDESKKQAAIALVQQKGLSREDLILLLNALQITKQNI